MILSPIRDSQWNISQLKLVPADIIITPQNKSSLNSILTEFGKPVSLKDFRNTISKLAIISSFTIYYAKNNPNWEIEIPLKITPT